MNNSYNEHYLDEYYDPETTIVHSWGPWKKHKYIKKVGSGINAIYYYGKKGVDAAKEGAEKLKEGIDYLDDSIKNGAKRASGNGIDKNTINSADKGAASNRKGVSDTVNKATAPARRAGKAFKDAQNAGDDAIKNGARRATRGKKDSSSTRSANRAANRNRKALKETVDPTVPSSYYKGTTKKSTTKSANATAKYNRDKLEKNTRGIRSAAKSAASYLKRRADVEISNAKSRSEENIRQTKNKRKSYEQRTGRSVTFPWRNK